MITRIILRSLGSLSPRLSPARSPTVLHRPQIPSSIPFQTQPIHRPYAAKSTADERIEEIQELYPLLPYPSSHFSQSSLSTKFPRSYATAKDEFDIASEETEKKTVYAADDRAAAQEELAKLKTAFEEMVKGEGGEEIQRRVGGRLRELERAVEVLEERGRED